MAHRVTFACRTRQSRRRRRSNPDAPRYQIYRHDGQWWYSVWNGAEWYTPQETDGYDSRADAEESAVAYLASV